MHKVYTETLHMNTITYHVIAIAAATFTIYYAWQLYRHVHIATQLLQIRRPSIFVNFIFLCIAMASDFF